MDRKSISDSEWKVMEILWRQPSVTLSEIVEALSGSGWSYSTIKTLLMRLMNKGYVTADKTSKNFRYSAVISEEACRLKEARGFLDKVFSGSVSLLVAALTKEAKITEQERKELLQLIESMDKEEGR